MICGSLIWTGLSWAVLPVSPEVTLGPWSAGSCPEAGWSKMSTLIRLAVGPAPGCGPGPLRTPPLLPAAGDRLTGTSVTPSLPGDTTDPAGMGRVLPPAPALCALGGSWCWPPSLTPGRCVVPFGGPLTPCRAQAHQGPSPCHAEDDDKA